jgi:hypothetical protein
MVSDCRWKLITQKGKNALLTTNLRHQPVFLHGIFTVHKRPSQILLVQPTTSPKLVKNTSNRCCF